MAHHIKKVIFVTNSTRQMAYTVPALTGVSNDVEVVLGRPLWREDLCFLKRPSRLPDWYY